MGSNHSILLFSQLSPKLLYLWQPYLSEGFAQAGFSKEELVDHYRANDCLLSNQYKVPLWEEGFREIDCLQ